MKMTKRVVWAVALVAAASALQAESPSEAKLMKEATVTRSQAEKVALAKVPRGTIKSGELEKEHGHLVWSFDIAKPGTKDIAEVQVDARSGKVVDVKTENPAQQAAEAVADKAKK
jgi:uncharacterized membrane protein YkoI